MYSPIPRELPPLDLMFVDDSTFGKLSADATEILLAERSVRIPSLRHLIAMKLHALRSGQPHRREKDMGDVLTLMQVNSVDLASPEYVEILTRYATADLAALNLPVPDEPLPAFHILPLEHSHLLNEQLWEDTIYDEAYFAESLAHKNPEPLVL